MPSRVRIRLTANGSRVYDTKAVVMLEQMYARSLVKGFSTKIAVLPEVKWRKAVVLFQSLKPYINSYDPGMRLLVLRERRGERSRIPTKEPSKVLKMKQTTRWPEGAPRRTAVLPDAGAVIQNDWPFNLLQPVQAVPVEGRAVVQNAVAGVQNFRWNFDNDPNR